MKRASLLFSAFVLIGMLFSTQVMGQGRIALNAARTTQECENVTMDGFSASFSYNSIESQKVNTEKGVFSVITMGNSIAAGNIGEPQVPVTREMIAVPFGATPVVNVKNYTVEEYQLSDFGIERLYPQQPSVRKDQKDVEFFYNEAAYASRGFDESRPIAEVTVMGTMRGIQIGALQINAVRYNASANTIRVYNNIEVEVSFANADLALTEQTLVNTYSPYFRTVYASLFNNRAITDIYDEHPDLWATPVKVLVIANRMFETTLEPWITWKTEKGFYMDVNYTDEIGTNANAIKTFITNKYNEGVAAGQAPTFVIIVGDQGQVPQSQMGSATGKVTDLYYYAVAGNDYYGDMFHSRFTCETTQELQNVLDKSLMYEQYTMPDPSYLSNVLLIAGWDGSWNPKVGKPTIQYATNYYYNAEHGFVEVNEFLQQPYNNPYASMNTGVNFVNYTAHGGDTGWSNPSFEASNVSSLTNNGKYFLAMGNCCLAANWGYSSKSLGEALIVAQDKGAYAYIGSPVETYWWEDYYFGVGATNTINAMPTYEGSTIGVYDAQFQDDFNSISAIPFIGNVAVCYAHANGYQNAISSGATDQYYWEAYHVLGDGSVTPYHTNPIENTVQHMPTLPIGMDFYTVEADPGSYVGISKDGVLYGAGEIGEEGVADIPIEPITSGGDVKIVVTHPQRQPYIAVVPAAAMTGAYIAVDSFTPGNVPCNEEQSMSITFKNVGAAATTGTTNVVLTCENENLTIIDSEGSFGALAQDETITLTDEFSFIVAAGVPDNTKIQIDVNATNGSDTWTGKAMVTVGAPIIEFANVQWAGSFVPGETLSVVANFHNKGHYQATNAVVNATSTSPYLTFVQATSTIGTIAVNGTSPALFTMTIDANCPDTEVIPIEFELTADNGVTATGSMSLKNSCNVVFELSDSYGDGWNGASLNVAFDGTSQNLTVASGNSAASYTIEMGNGTEVNLTWTSGSWDQECSFTIKYEDGDDILVGPQGSASSVLPFTFNVACAGEPIVETTDPVSNLEYTIDSINNILILVWEAPARDVVNYLVTRNGEELGTTTETTFTDNEPLEYAEYCVYAQYLTGVSEPICFEIGEVWGVEENNRTALVYPNPVRNTLNITMANCEFSYVLYNGMGQEMVSGTAQGSQQINVSNFSKGVYFLRVATGTQVNTQKVVVE